jgi:hypothetical protein
MTYVFDLDGTLCHTRGRDYTKAIPIVDRIAAVNRLSDEGHVIVIETARGTGTGTPWGAYTVQQLLHWGVRFDQLRVGTKAFGDLYVDDKGINAEAFFA